MIKAITSLLGILSGVMSYFNRKQDRDAGKNELKVDQLEKENEILKEQRDTRIDSIDSADIYWLRKDDESDK